MFKKILIANRGEIALRVARACRELGISSVAVHSTADANSLHVRFADESVCIGPPPAKESYLNIAALVSAAEVTGADAVHPGYGFLAENPTFAETCAQCNLTFIGPSADLLKKMGDKVEARDLMRSLGLPILPGTAVLDPAVDPLPEVRAIGFPVIIKATAGGGGRGMKIVDSPVHLHRQLDVARQEAQAAFGDGSVYVEKYLRTPRHIEVQIAADRTGRVLAVGERECSIQRRHQKLVEEAPAACLTPDEREQILHLCETAVAKMNYVTVGTLEFLYENGNFYFMEMNPRIQVEHTVTELTSGIDLVQEQIRLAAGMALSVEKRNCLGHAIECRINAEDPDTFAPHPGTISALCLPGGPGIRIDSHIYEGYKVPQFYDSMIAKLIAFAPTRAEAIARMQRALFEVVVEGIKTNVSLHRDLLADPQFLSGQFHTSFLEAWLTERREILAQRMP